MAEPPPDAFWCRVPSRANFGDALTPWLIHRLTGRYPRFRSADDPRHKHLVTGSVIGLAKAPGTVWGSGIMSAGDHLSDGLEILAVRGPLTRERALARNIPCPPVYGDPGLLLPRLYAPDIRATHDLGLALHFSDSPRITAQQFPIPLKLIDMQQPVEQVVDDILCCRLVASTSLHGLIVSHAYRRPAVWLEFRPLPSGDGSKFRDYLQSIGSGQQQPLRLSPDKLNLDLLQTWAVAPPRDFDDTPLWNACPFREAS